MRKRKRQKDNRNQSVRLYTSRAWRVARVEFLECNPYCVFCGEPSTTVDHIEPHKGNPDLFWSMTNWQALCETCHNSTKRRMENRKDCGIDINGEPTNAAHLWNRKGA